MANKCLVVLSGGQDSTTCLYYAKEMGYEVHAITFDYGQRHKIEIQSAIHIAQMAQVKSHEIVNLGNGILEGTSPLTNPDEELEQYADHHSLPGGLEKTFVPMRNQLFLTVAANRAFVRGIRIIMTGVCQEDSGGYPDCRAEFIDSFEKTSSLGTFNKDAGFPQGLAILTPLMDMTKAESVELAVTLLGCFEALAFSHTAYDGKFPPTSHDHANLLRAKGFEEAGYPDPLVLRAAGMGLMDLPETENYDEARVDY